MSVWLHGRIHDRHGKHDELKSSSVWRQTSWSNSVDSSPTGTRLQVRLRRVKTRIFRTLRVPRWEYVTYSLLFCLFRTRLYGSEPVPSESLKIWNRKMEHQTEQLTEQYRKMLIRKNLMNCSTYSPTLCLRSATFDLDQTFKSVHYSLKIICDYVDNVMTIASRICS